MERNRIATWWITWEDLNWPDPDTDAGLDMIRHRRGKPDMSKATWTPRRFARRRVWRIIIAACATLAACGAGFIVNQRTTQSYLDCVP